jgi:hypothetical protein
MDTPGLTSPSASEASSRMSLETRFSEGPTTQFFAGHRRQQSSIAVKPQATIKEEASKDNLKSTLAWQEFGTVRRHLDWEREADVEYRRARSQWTDSEESKMVLESELKRILRVTELMVQLSSRLPPVRRLPTSSLSPP